MNDAELKQLWARQQLASSAAAADTELVAKMKKKMRKFNRSLFWRDTRELAACVLTAGCFSYEFMRRRSTLETAGSLVIVLSAVFIGWRLISARRTHPPVQETAATGDFVRAELAKVSRQTHLLKTVLWWYLLPLFIGVELFELGHPQSLTDQLVTLAVNVALYGFIYWLNLRAVRKHLAPLKQELEHSLNSVPEFSSPTAQSKLNP
jgi:hypothetical protein